MAYGIVPLEGEKTLLIARKSPIVIWKQIVIAAVLVVMASVSLFFGANEYLYLLSIALFLILAVYVFVLFRVWFYDIYVVTNMRVILSEQKGLFHHESSEIDARDIVEVKSVRKGIWATILRHGSVVIITHQAKETWLTPVLDPDYVAQSIRVLGSATQRHEQ